jgi:hypothetical protein
MDIAKYKKSINDVRKESRIIQKENGLISGELKRLRRENGTLAKDVGKLELIVYGKVMRRVRSPRRKPAA